MIRFEYQAPKSLEEALYMLDKQGGQAMPMAGGTDLIVQMKNGQSCPQVIVDVKKIPELNRLEWSETEGLHIGAAVPLSRLASFHPLMERYEFLAQACSMIGSIQVRNRATMGGNICNAAPSADTPPPLLCLGAKVVIACQSGTRTVPLESFFLAPDRTTLEPNELLVEIEVPTPPPFSAGCYLRHTPRAEMDIAVAGVASFLVLIPEQNVVQEARISLGAVAPMPTRTPQAEAVLVGKAPTPDLIEEAAIRAAESAQPISDMRGSAGYRRQLVKVLTRRTLNRACKILGI